jgi:hypothetical protein
MNKCKEEICTVCSHGNTNDLLKNVHSEVDKDIIDKVLQHTDQDDIIFYVTVFVFYFILDKLIRDLTSNK